MSRPLGDLAPKTHGPVQRGKKGGTFVVTQSGRKRYVKR